MAYQIEGMNEVMRNLRREIARIEGLTLEGVVEAANFIKGEAMEITPMSDGQRLPGGAIREGGTLVNSAFTDSDVTSRGPVSRVGYTAPYAAAVHEMPATTNWSKPGTGNKFLEKPIARNHNKILRILRDAARIP